MSGTSHLRFEGGSLDGETPVSPFPEWPPPDRVAIVVGPNGVQHVGDAAEGLVAGLANEFYARDPERTSELSDKQIADAPVALRRGAVYVIEEGER